MKAYKKWIIVIICVICGLVYYFNVESLHLAKRDSLINDKGACHETCIVVTTNRVVEYLQKVYVDESMNLNIDNIIQMIKKDNEFYSIGLPYVASWKPVKIEVYSIDEPAKLIKKLYK